MGKAKTLKDKLFGAAVLKMSFRLRGDEESPAFKFVYPGVLAIFAPITVGFGLGITALGSYLAGAIAAGTLMAVMLANAGGSWDNAKKLVEDGHYGGKGSAAHEATVIGDTVGDPFKDTSGPSINPLLKVMNLVALLIAPAIVTMSYGDDASDPLRFTIAGVSLAIIVVAVVVARNRATAITDDPGAGDDGHHGGGHGGEPDEITPSGVDYDATSDEDREPRRGPVPDAPEWGDAGSDTLGHICESRSLKLPNLQSWGLGNVRPLNGVAPASSPRGSYGKCALRSNGKDTTTGHWEMAGIILDQAFPTYPNGFPSSIVDRFVTETGVPGILGNVPASGTEIIKQLGAEHVQTGKPIVYTSADSVFQIAAHEEVIPLEQLYEICETARGILDGTRRLTQRDARPQVE